MKTIDNKQSFGVRLASLRKQRGFTQAEFARKIGISRRALAYYEVETDKMPGGNLLLIMADVLGITVDQLLGVKQIKRKERSPKEARLMNKLKKVHGLSKQDQKAVLRYIDALLETSAVAAKTD